jgi:hypothetical protein
MPIASPVSGGAGIVRDPPPADPVRLPDPNGAHLLALLDTDSRAVLVTGDRRLLTAAAFRGRIHSPAEALEPPPACL